jgi:hypothetical protein
MRLPWFEMEAFLEERLARNEAFFRDLNERIRDAADAHSADGHVYEFVCECSDQVCLERVRLTAAEYESVRADPTTFVLAPGHAQASIEVVVQPGYDHVIVEKIGAAGALAVALDPRAS